MAIGLYVHVPFCKKKCSYCDFVSYPYDAGLAASYLYALEKEMGLRAAGMPEEQKAVKSIYVGGGTPTVLAGKQIASILDSCRRYFDVGDEAEVTVECNPGTVDENKLKVIRETGFNRVSIGVQAYQEEMLSRLGRIHSWRQVVDAVSWCRMAGFDNLSLDLIFGIPGQNISQWRETLKRVTDLMPQHISAYNLKIEPDTPLHRDVASGYLVPCDEDLELEMYWYAVSFLTGNGFEHYEISNFAQNGREALHNLIYWNNGEYLGLGPAAHSRLGSRRFSNVESVELYSKKPGDFEAPAGTHGLTLEEDMSETVFLGLRLTRGLNLKEFELRFAVSVFEQFGHQIKKLTGLGLIEICENNLKLTEKGIPIANEVFLEFV